MTTRTDSARCIAAVICFPLVLLIINDSWAFLAPAAWIDPYVYTGYFFNLKQHLNVFSDAYYGARLPWLLLGASVHAVAPPELASYALRLVLFYAATLSLFAIVRMLFKNDVAATMAAFVMGANTYFLWAIGWDYVDGIGIALTLVTTACLTAAATGKYWRLWLVCAGIACTSMVIGYVMLILTLPFQIAGYLFLNAFHRRNALVSGVACLAAGAAIAIGTFGGINWVLTGRFLFFLPQLGPVLAISADREQWKLPSYDWVANATWLVFPAIALAVGLVFLSWALYLRLKGRIVNDALRHAVLLALLLIGVETTFLLMELNGFWLLQYSFYASYLIPHAFICIGAAIALATAEWSGTRGTRLIGAAAASLLVPFMVASFRPSLACAPTCQLAGPVGWLALVGSLILAGAAVFRNAWLTWPALMVLGMVNISAADTRIFAFPPSAAAHSQALMVPDAIAAIRPFNQDGNLRLWYDLQDPLGRVFRAVAAANLWAYRLVSEDFPGLTAPLPDAPRELGLGDSIVILTSKDDALRLATSGLSALGARPEMLGHRYVSRGDKGFHLTFIRLVPAQVDGALELDLSAMNFAPEAQVNAAGGDVAIRIAAAPWAYAAQLPIPKVLRDDFGDCSGMFKMHVQVKRSAVGLGVVNAAGTDFLVRRLVRPASSAIDVQLGVMRLSDAGNIVIQAWDTATEGVVDVKSITLVRHGCPAGR